MPLSQDEVSAIAQLIDQRLAVHQQAITTALADSERRAARRRRFWLWFFILSTLISGVLSWWAVRRMVHQAEDLVVSFQAETAATRASYARLLREDEQARTQAALAARTVHYDSTQNQGDFDANLLNQTIALFNRSHAVATRMKNRPTSSEADDAADLDAFSGIVDQAGALTMRLLLHEADPAHETREERLANGETGTPGITTPQPSGITLHTPPASAPAAPPAGAAPHPAP